jgi:hypothetical protein
MSPSRTQKTGLESSRPSRHRVVSARIERITPNNAFHRQPCAFDGPMFINGLVTVMRTGRVEPTCIRGQCRRDHRLIHSNQGKQNQAWKIPHRKGQIAQARLIRVIVIHSQNASKGAPFPVTSPAQLALPSNRLRAGAFAPAEADPIRASDQAKGVASRHATVVWRGFAPPPGLSTARPQCLPAPAPTDWERPAKQQAGAGKTCQYAAPFRNRWIVSGDTCDSPIYLFPECLVIRVFSGPSSIMVYQRMRLVWLFMETVRRWRPLSRRRLRTSRPSRVSIRERKPCTRRRRRILGWYVRFVDMHVPFLIFYCRFTPRRAKRSVRKTIMSRPFVSSRPEIFTV